MAEVSEAEGSDRIQPNQTHRDRKYGPMRVGSIWIKCQFLVLLRHKLLVVWDTCAELVVYLGCVKGW